MLLIEPPAFNCVLAFMLACSCRLDAVDLAASLHLSFGFHALPPFAFICW
jgi:hypothetical protein